MRLSLILALTVTPLLSAPALADCTSDIKDVLVRANASGPYRMETVVAGSAGDMTMTAEVIPPTAMHSTTVTDGQTIEMVFADGKGWMNLAGTWSELPPDAATEMTKSFDPEFIESLGTIQEAKCLGTVTIEGKDYLGYEYTFAMEGMSSVSKMYVDPATTLPARMEAVSEISGGKTDTVVTYTYDPSVTVTAPQM